MDELRRLLDEVIRERDELVKSLEAEQAKIKKIECEAGKMHEERDDAIEYGDCEHEFAETLKKERDEAREAARFFRDLYVSQVGRTYPEEYRLPWEAEE